MEVNDGNVDADALPDGLPGETPSSLADKADGIVFVLSDDWREDHFFTIVTNELLCAEVNIPDDIVAQANAMQAAHRAKHRHNTMDK
jgi:hypothetical protein